MDNSTNSSDVLKANTYRMYLLGWAYIPLQDLPIYENAYKRINNN